MKSIRLALLPGALALACGAAQAVPLVYDESLHGDLGMGTVTMLPIDVGLNSVRGQITVISHPDGEFDLDLDPFIIQLPAGLQITALSIATSFSDATGNTEFFKAFWRVAESDDFSPYWDSCFLLTGSAEDCDGSAQGGALIAGLPLSASGYLLTQASHHLWKNDSLSSGGSYSYTVSMQVSAIPEPANAALLLGGLGLLGVALRRR